MKYNISERVEIKNTSKIVTIIDFEVFNDLILYYTNDKSAYPEDELNPEGYNFFKTFVLKSDKEKNDLFLSVLEKNGGDVVFD
jgi:hypothetical protein